MFSLSLTRYVRQLSLPEALVSYRRWCEIRLAMLLAPALFNLTLYYTTLDVTCLLCMGMLLVASLFCVPGKTNRKNEHAMKQGNISLRAPEPEDLEVMLSFENDAALWELGTATGPYSRYQMKRYIAESQNDLYADGQLRLMIVCEGQGVAGIVDVFSFDARHNRAERFLFWNRTASLCWGSGNCMPMCRWGM